MRRRVGIVGRLVFWICLMWIVAQAALLSWARGDHILAVAKVAFFPVTFFVFPWFVPHTWIVLLVAMTGYWISTFVGRMKPIDWDQLPDEENSKHQLQAVADCIIKTCHEEVAKLSELSAKLRVDSKPEAERRIVFFVLFNFDLRIDQFLGTERRKCILAMVWPKICQFLHQSPDRFELEYQTHAKAFYSILEDFHKEVKGNDQASIEMGKRICIIITLGIDAWHRFEELKPQKELGEGLVLQLNGGLESTIQGLQYVQVSNSIGEICRRLQTVIV